MFRSVKKNAKNHAVILVDFFDTLVFRTVHPLDIARVWACQARARLSVTCDWETLHDTRMEALETIALRRGYGAGVWPPLRYPFSEWLLAFYERLRNSALFAGEPPAFERFCAEVLDVEERVELAAQVPNEPLLALLREWRAAGKRLYVVSDFYLPRNSLERFLNAAGAGDLFDDIFVSCDLGKTKQEGDIYPAVLNAIGRKPAEAFMFGDNYVADFKQPRKHGIAAVQIKHRYNSVTGKLRRLWQTRRDPVEPLRRVFESAFLEHEQHCRRHGPPFAEYALPYFFFVEKLFFRVRERGIRDVVFLAREGLLLKTFFETWLSVRVAPAERPRTHYLRMSRRAAAILQLQPLERETFWGIAGSDNLTLAQFLDACGIAAGVAAEIVAAGAGNPSATFDAAPGKLHTSPLFTALAGNEKFRAAYEVARSENRAAFKQLWDELGVAPEGEIAVVDVGWTGRMQDALANITGRSTTGLYLGLRTPAHTYPKHNKEGLLFSIFPRRGLFHAHLDANRQLYEQLLMAPHGGVLSYTLDAGTVVVREDYRPVERECYEKHVRTVQLFMRETIQRLAGDARLQAWRDEWLLCRCADLVTRSGMFAAGKRAAFLREISRGFVDNFASVKIGARYDAADAQPVAAATSGSLRARLAHVLALAWILWRDPARLVRYAVKVWASENVLARVVWRLGGARLLYWLFFKPRHCA
jgi:FMN phosphatase YigB (HAD superfamily)